MSKLTPDKRQSKTLLPIDERGSKIATNSVFDCHLSPIGRQMTIKNSVSGDFYLRSSIVLTFSSAAYPVYPSFSRKPTSKIFYSIFFAPSKEASSASSLKENTWQ